MVIKCCWVVMIIDNTRACSAVLSSITEAHDIDILSFKLVITAFITLNSILKTILIFNYFIHCRVFK